MRPRRLRPPHPGPGLIHGRADLAADVLAPGPGEGGGRLSAWIWAVPADCAAAYRPCLFAINLISQGYRPATLDFLDAVTVTEFDQIFLR